MTIVSAAGQTVGLLREDSTNEGASRMGVGSWSLVFSILVALFVAVGLYLIWYSFRRKKMLKTFAGRHGFRLRPEKEDDIQQTLDNCYSLRHRGLLREFGQLASLVEGEGVWLFRTVELLDLYPRSQSSSTHYSRIAALFGIPPAHNEYFLLDREGRATARLPNAEEPDPQVVEIARRAASSCHARHSLSVTLSCEHGLVYFEPWLTGGESSEDVDCLFRLAKKMREQLS